MAVAIVQDWPEEETDRSTANYDAISARLQQQAPPEGLLVHTAGFTGQGFRIFEVWESRDHFDRFVEELLMPIVTEVAGTEGARPEITSYELHNVVTV